MITSSDALSSGRRVLLCDFNNFARYPTLSIGYLAAILRRAGFDVEVFSPLASGVTGVVREPRPRPWGVVDQRLRYWSAVTPSPAVRSLRRYASRRLHGPKLARHVSEVATAFTTRIAAARYDAVLVSTYLVYHPLCEKICRACRDRGIPVLVGGPYFAQPEVRREWLSIDGLSGLVGGEVELELPAIVDAMIDGRSLAAFDGIWGPDRAEGAAAAPLRNLDRLPFPDYGDFPWPRYPNRIVPVLTGRGCGWGVCTFCSDITSTAGRTFRTRSPEDVLDEIEQQVDRYDADMLVFTDLKLNSSRPMWDTLTDELADRAPGVRWIASVHVGTRRDQGLDRDQLRRAAAAGLVRLTTGLESGSQRVLDLMRKGTDLGVTSRALHDARDAGISVRVTMIVGYPGETAADVRRTASYLADHEDCIERVALNRFAVMTGTRFHRVLDRKPDVFPGMTPITVNHREATIEHHNRETEDRDYRRAIGSVIEVVHRINRRPLLVPARVFEGVM